METVLPPTFALALLSPAPRRPPRRAQRLVLCHLPGSGKQMALAMWGSFNFKHSLWLSDRCTAFLVQKLRSAVCTAVNPVSSRRLWPRKGQPPERQGGHFIKAGEQLELGSDWASIKPAHCPQLHKSLRRHDGCARVHFIWGGKQGSEKRCACPGPVAGQR